MNKSVTKYIFSYRAFPAEHDGDIYFHVQQFLQNLEGLLQHHVSPFIPPSPVLSQYIPFYEVRRNITRTGNGLNFHLFHFSVPDASFNYISLLSSTPPSRRLSLL